LYLVIYAFFVQIQGNLHRACMVPLHVRKRSKSTWSLHSVQKTLFDRRSQCLKGAKTETNHQNCCNLSRTEAFQNGEMKKASNI